MSDEPGPFHGVEVADAGLLLVIEAAAERAGTLKAGTSDVSTLLRALTDTPLAGAHMCRFCDERACPPDRCPVHRRAVEFLPPANHK